MFQLISANPHYGRYNNNWQGNRHSGGHGGWGHGGYGHGGYGHGGWGHSGLSYSGWNPSGWNVGYGGWSGHGGWSGVCPSHCIGSAGLAYGNCYNQGLYCGSSSISDTCWNDCYRTYGSYDSCSC